MEAEEAELAALQVRQLAADTQFHAEVGAGGKATPLLALTGLPASRLAVHVMRRNGSCRQRLQRPFCLTFPSGSQTLTDCSTEPQPLPVHLHPNRLLSPLPPMAAAPRCLANCNSRVAASRRCLTPVPRPCGRCWSARRRRWCRRARTWQPWRLIAQLKQRSYQVGREGVTEGGGRLRVGVCGRGVAGVGVAVKGWQGRV